MCIMSWKVMGRLSGLGWGECGGEDECEKNGSAQ